MQGAFHAGIALLDTHTWRWSNPSTEVQACFLAWAWVWNRAGLILLHATTHLSLHAMQSYCSQHTSGHLNSAPVASLHTAASLCQLADGACQGCPETPDHCLQGNVRPAGRLGQSGVVLKDADGASHLVVHGGRAMDDELCYDTWALQLPAALPQAA